MSVNPNIYIDQVSGNLPELPVRYAHEGPASMRVPQASIRVAPPRAPERANPTYELPPASIGDFEPEIFPMEASLH